MTERELSQAVHLKAELRDAARKVHANNVDRGRYEPYWKLGLRSTFIE
nr:MAG: hypothetical protein [Bacteriophage sp.]